MNINNIFFGASYSLCSACTQDDTLIKLKQKTEEVEKLKAQLAKLEIENENLKRETKKTS